MTKKSDFHIGFITCFGKIWLWFGEKDVLKLGKVLLIGTIYIKRKTLNCVSVYMFTSCNKINASKTHY